MKKLHHLLLITLLSAHGIITTQSKPSLHQAIRAGKTEEVKQRIEKGEDCSETDPDTGDNALHIAAETNNPEIAALLTQEPDYSGWNNWFYYCIYSPAKLPNKNGKNNKGDTPLQRALDANNPEMAAYLIDKDVDTVNINAARLPAAFVIIDKINKKDERVMTLLTKKQLLKQRFNGDNPFGYAVKRGNIIAAQELAARTKLAHEQNERGETGAIVAAKSPNTNMLQILHDNGVNFNTPGHQGKRPIHHASATGNYDGVKFLLEHGASLDVTDDNGNNPVQSAIAGGNESVCNLLIAHRADIQHCNNEGLDAFGIAIDNGRLNIAKRLKENHHADINKRDKYGRTPFMRSAAMGKHTNMQELIAMGVNIGIGDNNGSSSLHAAIANDDAAGAEIILNKDKSLLHHTNKDGDSPLFIAGRRGCSATIRLLLKYDTPHNQKNKKGESFFHQIAQSNNVTILSEELRKQSNAGALNAKDNNGNNLAHAAATAGAYDTVKYLKQNAPHLFLERNNQSNTPFVVAPNEHVSRLLFDKDSFINGDVRRAIKWSAENRCFDVHAFLKKEENKRLDEGKQLNHNYRLTKLSIQDNNELHRKLCEKNGWFAVAYYLYTPSQPQYYSEEEFYYMNDTQRSEIMNESLNCLNTELSHNKNLMSSLNTILAQEEQQRIAKQQAERQAELERELKKQQEVEAKKRAEEKRLIAQQAAEIERCKQQKREQDALRAQENEHKMLNKQNALHKECNQQRDIIKECNDQHTAINQHKDKQTQDQHAELKYWNDQKAAKDAERAREARHAHALEGQHIPASMQPSAPAMEDGDAILIISKHGECCICFEEGNVTTIPCKNCNKDTASSCLCTGCLGDLLKRPNTSTLCPGCLENTLEKNYKIFPQK